VQTYPSKIEKQMKKFFRTLSEKDRRLYAAIEALKLGHGGIEYISKLFSINPNTISRAIEELKNLSDNSDNDKRVRRPGGGRKQYDEVIPGIDENFLDVLVNNTAGDPMKDNVKWTNLSQQQIAHMLEEKYGIVVSRMVIRRLLKKHNYRRRKAQKRETMKNVENRNEQFENIAKLKSEYTKAGWPVISIDTKKKEYIGNFYREGHIYTQEVITTWDHDFNSFAEGIVIPHGVYDLIQNKCYISIGTSKDTGELACDSIRNWWYNDGRQHYSNAPSILIVCDSGGSNNCRHHLFKQDIQKLADELGIEIRIAHYPPYTSKYNPIEHRVFPHITRACQGVIFDSVKTVKNLIEKAKTKTGLKVIAQVVDKIYQTGRKTAENFKENMRIIFDDYLPQWNYRAVPIKPQNPIVI
jgi:hypothetical protein